MDISKRENIEWLNYWIEEADADRKRIILLGDSVTREWRKKLQLYLKTKYAVDLLAMSYSILDDMVLQEIKHYFQSSPYRYEYIIYQMGAHHGYNIACAGSEEDAERFTGRTTELLEYLKQYSLQVIAVSSTFERCFNQEGKKLFHHNEEIVKRNQLLENVARKIKVYFFDLNKIIDNWILRYTDWCHFYEQCYEYMAGIFVADFFPDIMYIPSNQVETVRELDEKLGLYKNKKIYIYGNGIRARRLKVYLNAQGYRFDGFIVSDEYIKTANQAFSLKEIENKEALVIVTPTELEVWKRLDQNQFHYITLHEDVNTFLRMYVDWKRLGIKS